MITVATETAIWNPTPANSRSRSRDLTQSTVPSSHAGVADCSKDWKDWLPECSGSFADPPLCNC